MNILKKFVFRKFILVKFMIIVLLSSICFSTVILKASLNISADGYILLESNSKRVLDGRNIHKRYLTASICKILTAIIVIENTNIDDYLVVSKQTTRQIGSSIYLKENDALKIRDLLYGLLLRSGNDCAYLLATGLCYTENNFSIMMNKYAKMIGMSDSTFSNPSGLDDDNNMNNYSSPYDMALLMAYCMKNPVFREITSEKRHICESIDENKFYFYNKHKLIQKYDYIIGGKTGYTEKAGRTLVSYAKKNNMELVCVTFKSSNDWNEHINLFEKGFNEYEIKNVISKGIIKTNNDYKLTPYLKEDVNLPLKKHEKEKITIYLLNDPKEEVIGKIYIKLDNYLYENNLYRYY